MGVGKSSEVPPPKKKPDGNLLYTGPKICEDSCLKDLAEAGKHKRNNLGLYLLGAVYTFVFKIQLEA